MDVPSPSNRSSTSGDKSRDATPEQPSNRSKAGIRVSLACVPCRSKHIKCDATLPVCQRCQSEQKQCYYAKSRRGIRDPKQRSLVVEKPHIIDSPGDFWPLPQTANSHVPIRLLDSQSSSWNLPDGQTAETSITTTLLDSYYANFYESHPWTLPKHYMVGHITAAPNDVQFLVSAFCYVGSVFEPTISSQQFRDAVFSEACGLLTSNVFTVQGLLTLSIAALGERTLNLSDVLMDRAIQMALDLGMHLRNFADTESDATVAESYRRTYWALYVHDCIRTARMARSTFRLSGVAATTDIPCEEWEYQSGRIPRPVTLLEYDNRDPVEEPDFSSWAYMIELCRIVGEVYLPLKLRPDSWVEESNRAEMRIMNWLLRIPKWKNNIVGSSGHPDWVIHMAIGLAHTIRLRLKWPTERSRLRLRDGFCMGPLERPEAPPPRDPNLPWDFCPPELQATNALCDLIARSPVATMPWSPVNIAALDRIATGLLDACVFLSCDTYATREKLSLVFAILKRHSGVWPLAREIASSVKLVARTYLQATPQNEQRVGVGGSTAGRTDGTTGGSATMQPTGVASTTWPLVMSSPDLVVTPAPVVSMGGNIFSHITAADVPGFEDWLVGD